MDVKQFRKENLERVSSPEQLNQFIKVSNPSVWLLLVAVIVLLVGVYVWGVMGQLETTVPCKVIAQGDEVLCLLTEKAQVADGMTLRVQQQSAPVWQVSAVPSAYETLVGTLSEYELYAAGTAQGDWVRTARASLCLSEGVYDGQIVEDSVSPLSFLLN